MKESYGQFMIEYDENAEKFIGKLGETRIGSSGKLSSLKKTLDQHGESEKAFTRVKIFKHEPWEGWVFGEVTSIGDDRNPWCSWTDKYGKKSRGKPLGTTILYLDTPENAEIRGRVDVLDERIMLLRAERESLAETMVVFEAGKA